MIMVFLSPNLGSKGLILDAKAEGYTFDDKLLGVMMLRQSTVPRRLYPETMSKATPGAAALTPDSMGSALMALFSDEVSVELGEGEASQTILTANDEDADEAEPFSVMVCETDSNGNEVWVSREMFLQRRQFGGRGRGGRRFQGRRPPRDPRNVKCYSCGEKGHFARDCKRNKEDFHLYTVSESCLAAVEFSPVRGTLSAICDTGCTKTVTGSTLIAAVESWRGEQLERAAEQRSFLFGNDKKRSLGQAKIPCVIEGTRGDITVDVVDDSEATRKIPLLLSNSTMSGLGILLDPSDQGEGRLLGKSHTFRRSDKGLHLLDVHVRRSEQVFDTVSTNASSPQPSQQLHVHQPQQPPISLLGAQLPAVSNRPQPTTLHTTSLPDLKAIKTEDEDLGEFQDFEQLKKEVLRIHEQNSAAAHN